jgi:hypothetical protein
MRKSSVSKHSEGVSPPSVAKIFYGWHMSGPGRENNECLSPDVVARGDANAKVATYLDLGKRQRADDCEECRLSIVAPINKANDALGLR